MDHIDSERKQKLMNVIDTAYKFVTIIKIVFLFIF